MGRILYARSLYLSRLGQKDAAALAELLRQNYESLSEWFPAMPDKFTDKNVRKWIKQEHSSIRSGKRIDLGIFSYEQQLIGRVALHSIEMGVCRSAGISYWLDSNFRGRSLAISAVATFLSFVFEELRLHRIWASIISDNSASLKLCEKLGFRCEGLISQGLFINDRWQDTRLMAMLETEYDALAQNWIKSGYLGY